MKPNLIGILAVTLTAGLPLTASSSPDERPHFFTDPPAEIERKMQSARETLAAELVEMVKSQSRSGKVAIHHNGMTKFRMAADCSSTPVHTLYPEARDAIEGKLRDLGISIVSDKSTEEAKDRVLSQQSMELWEDLGIVDPKTSMKVGRATDAVFAILLEPEEIWVYADRQVVQAEARALDTNAKVVLGKATVSVELQHKQKCPPFSFQR